MDASTFSAALFSLVCRDLNLDVPIPTSSRFGERLDDYLNPFFGDERSAAKFQLVRSLFKKSEVECADDARESTLKKFHEANQASLDWKLVEVEDLAVGYSIAYARSLLADWFEPLSGTELTCTMASIESRARFGPGQSVGHGNRPTHYYFKVGDAPMTAGSDFVRSWYGLSIRRNPLCEAAEMARTARHGPIELTNKGSLNLVNKSYTSLRVVVTEPTCNVFFQLGLGEVVGEVLASRTGLRIASQAERNSELARLGSITGEYSTMDLRQCSDYIALGLVDYMFPKSVSAWIRKLRTPVVTYEGVDTPLGMFATMGCGFTFPVQTALLAAVILGVYRTLDIRAVRPDKDQPGNYGVYGDDIVCAQKAFNLVSKVLTHLGMKVNDDKSFTDGPFRESCGRDWYNGFDVRGVYVRKYGWCIMDNLHDLYSIFNRLAIWSAKQAIGLPSTLAWLRNVIGKEHFCFVPPDEPINSGIISPVPPGPEGPNGLWKYRVWIPKLSSFRLNLWEAQQNNTGRSPRVTSRLWLREILEYTDGTYNEPAMLKALLYGAVRRDRVTFRSDRDELTFKYRQVTRTTPRWGWSGAEAIQNMDELSTDRWMRSVVCYMVCGANAP